jgi:hypothetical protein
MPASVAVMFGIITPDDATAEHDVAIDSLAIGLVVLYRQTENNPGDVAVPALWTAQCRRVGWADKYLHVDRCLGRQGRLGERVVVVATVNEAVIDPNRGLSY